MGRKEIKMKEERKDKMWERKDKMWEMTKLDGGERERERERE